MSNMELAISKWEADREFVENYKIGHYTQFGVFVYFQSFFTNEVHPVL